jgi:murein L,D-transpeptidase YafK
MKPTFILLLIMGLMAMTPPDFYTQQLRFPRVRDAVKKRSKDVDNILTAAGLNTRNYEIFLRAFKKEQKLELWGRNKGTSEFKMIKTYDFCATSGVLGPKRRSGDRQIPEGFYTVDFFNPQSEFYLSFRVNYPNTSDLVFADKLNPGDNIFIHGHCATIGCIPVGDPNIEEIYQMVIRAKATGQDIPVHIFPARMDDTGYSALKSEFSGNASLLEFWSWLKPGFDAFEGSKTLPKVSVDAAGKYVVN